MKGKSETKEGAEEKEREDFDTETAAFPLFCVTKPTNDYRAFLDEYARLYRVYWIEITANRPSRDQLLAEINGDDADDEFGPYPFLNGNLNSVHQYWAQTIRPGLDSRSWEPFARDTYLIVDQECVDAGKDPNIIVCTGAPDYDDDQYDDENDPKVTLKVWHLFMPLAFRMLNMVDALMATPSEALVLDDEGEALCSIPPFTYKSIPETAREYIYCVATPAEARRAKRRASRLRPESKGDKVIDEGRDRAVIFLTTLREARDVADMYRLLDASSRKDGGLLSFDSNPSQTQKDEMDRKLYEDRQRKEEAQAGEVGGSEPRGASWSRSQEGRLEQSREKILS